VRNDLLAAVAVLFALMIGYWLFHGAGSKGHRWSGPSSSAGGAQLMGEDYAKASGIFRVSVSEFYVSNGKMPKGNADAGLLPPAEYRGQTLRSATVLADGGIDLEFDANSGVDGGHVRLVADTSHANAMGLQWHCETDDYPDIGRVIPTCRYSGR